MAEPSELNLWTCQWRAERIRKARADFRERASAYECLKDKSTDYAESIRMARDVCEQVLALWEASPVDLPASVSHPQAKDTPSASPSSLPAEQQESRNAYASGLPGTSNGQENGNG